MAESAKSIAAADGDFNFAETVFDKNRTPKDDSNKRKRPANKEKPAKNKPEQFQKGKGVEPIVVDDTETGLPSARLSQGHVASPSGKKSSLPSLEKEEDGHGISLTFFRNEMDKFRYELKNLIGEAVSGGAGQSLGGTSDPNLKQHGRRRTHSYSDETDDDFSVLTQNRFKIPKLSDNKDSGDVAVEEQVDELFQEDQNRNKNSLADEDHEFEDSLETDYVITDDVGKDINPKIASIINNMFATNMPTENLSSILDKYSERPGNLNIWLPAVNKEVWNRLQPSSRSQDLKLQKFSNKLVRCSYTLATLADDLMNLRKSCPADKQSDFKGAIKKVLDTVAILSATSQDYSQQRRSALRNDNFDLAGQVCAASNNIDVGGSPKLLFGDDLPRKIKEYKEANLISTRRSSNYSSNYKFQHTSNQARSYKGSPQYSDKGKSFLGHRKTYQKGGGSKSSYQKSWKYDKKK